MAVELPSRWLPCLLVAWTAAAQSQAGGENVDTALVRRGEYVAVLADCAACHTAPGGKAYAGGREMETPFGTIHSTNITPDPDTGIGRDSFEQFDRAVRKGMDAEGENLYPVMPYPSFAKITPEDMRALYAYFQHGVAPLRQADQENSLRWPFNMRIGLTVWNWLFLDTQAFRPDPSRSARWNRGAYLLQGPGHCGACHTPRGAGMQELAMAGEGARGSAYLSGSTVDAWHAPGLRLAWPAGEIESFLKSGRNSHAAAYGSMAEVVHLSTQRFSDEDLAAIAEYLGSLSGGTPQAAAPTLAEAKPRTLYTTAGGLGYVQFCAACHRLNGRGVPDFFPPLAENDSILSVDPTSLLHIVLAGGRSPQTLRYPRAWAMPAFGSLGDDEIAEILSFVRSNWGNRATQVTAQQVRQLRTDVRWKPVETPTFQTPRYAQFLKSANAEQLVYGMRLVTETREFLPNKVGNQLACTSCHINGGTVAKGAPFVGVAGLFPAYAPRSGRVIDFPERVNGCFRRSMHGKPLDRESREMAAMVAYISWMRSDAKPGEPIPGRGVGRIADVIVPNAKNGKKIYRETCAACHGEKGEGHRLPDGEMAFPPLAGAGSFNIGAGMARTRTAAGFVRNNMPIAAGLQYAQGQGGLTDQQAVDVSEYFTHLPRPDFPEKKKDWPKGGKPRDARY